MVSLLLQIKIVYLQKQIGYLLHVGDQVKNKCADDLSHLNKEIH